MLIFCALGNIRFARKMHRKEPNERKSEMPTDLTAYTGHVILARTESGGSPTLNMRSSGRGLLGTGLQRRGRVRNVC